MGALSPSLNRVLVLAMLGSILLTPGCGGSGGPKTYPVTGIVTLAGRPVDGATVQFFPAGEGTPTGGQAMTGSDGTFEVESTFDVGKTMQKGLPAGEYHISVTKMEMPSGDPSLSRPPKNTLPTAYGSPETSKLTVTVSSDGENRCELKL